MPSFVESDISSSLRQEDFYVASRLPYVRNPYKNLSFFFYCDFYGKKVVVSFCMFMKTYYTPLEISEDGEAERSHITCLTSSSNSRPS